MSKFRFDNMDAAESAFFSRQLEHIRPGLLEVLYPELKAKSFVPVNSAVAPGAEEYTYRFFNKVGKAELISDYSVRSPRADILGTEASSKLRSMGSSYGYSFQEARAAQMAGLDLSNRKAMAARTAIEQKMDDVLLLGDGTEPYLYMTGLFKQSGTATYSTPNGAYGDTEWEGKTPDEIITDLHGIPNGIVASSLEVYRPNTLILPLTSYNLIATRRMGDGSNTTILEFFKGTSQYVTSVLSSTKLETAGSGSSKRMVCYERAPDKLEAIIPVTFEQFTPQFDGMEVVTQCHARTGGVVVYHPKALSYADNI